eukprot:sb/3473660/
MGASDRPEGSKHLFKELPGLYKKTMNQELESYCIRKANCISTGSDLRYECHLAALEILYIWRYLTFTEQQAEFMVHTVENRPRDLTPASLASSYLFLGQAWLNLESISRAQQAFQVADNINQPNSRDNYICVATLCELTEIYLYTNQV